VESGCRISSHPERFPDLGTVTCHGIVSSGVHALGAAIFGEVPVTSLPVRKPCGAVSVADAPVNTIGFVDPP
jgi:hypothetical protein